MEDQSHTKKKYTLENLIKTFAEHAKEADKQQKIFVKNFKENFPEAPLPDHLKEDFNIAQALVTITKEIKKLQNKSAA